MAGNLNLRQIWISTIGYSFQYENIGAYLDFVDISIFVRNIVDHIHGKMMITNSYNYYLKYGIRSRAHPSDGIPPWTLLRSRISRVAAPTIEWQITGESLRVSRHLTFVYGQQQQQRSVPKLIFICEFQCVKASATHKGSRHFQGCPSIVTGRMWPMIIDEIKKR